MPSINLDSLIFCVTRRCNMSCEHCLRGEAQNTDIPLDYIDKALKDVSYIDSLCFTGGEPTLNIEAIKHVINVIKHKHIDVGSFYLVTNGHEVNYDLAIVLLELYALCDEKELCILCLSHDQYHDYCEAYDDPGIYQGLSFFKPDDRPDYVEDKYLISEGRAKENNLSLRKPLEIEDLIYTIDDNEDISIRVSLYIGTTGNIVTSCDLSYEREEKVALGNLKNQSLLEIIETAGINEGA